MSSWTLLPTRFRLSALFGAFLLSTGLAGCGVGSMETLFIKPGKFDYFTCADIATATKSATRREQELKELIARAEQESFGVFMATMSYRSDYLRARGELAQLAEVSQSKNCENQPTP